MRLPPALEKGAARFDAMSLRERLLLSAAALAALLMIWTMAVLDPIKARENFLKSEMTTLQETLAATTQSIESNGASNPVSLALATENKLQDELKRIDEQLVSKSGGLVPPEHMVQVIHDVLDRQHGVKLVSLHNKPVTPLVQPALAAPASQQPVEPESGPYVHPVELIVEGSYLDVLDYLRALERLDWHFHWKALELNTTEYPVNRVRIELSTLSLDREWIGM